MLNQMRQYHQVFYLKKIFFKTIHFSVVSNTPYPFAATNLRVREEFNNINLTWNDTHDLLDPIEYIVLCNSRNNSMRNVGRNTTYLCENMLFNETNTMSVQTRVAIPGYTHDQIAVARINGIYKKFFCFYLFKSLF
jgi:hypothetical protein